MSPSFMLPPLFRRSCDSSEIDRQGLHYANLISERSCFFESIFDRFLQFSQKLFRITKSFIYHMKDLKKEHLILLRQRAWLSLKDSHALEIEPRTVSTKIDILAFADHLHPISKILSIGTLQGFLLKYVTLSQLNRLKRYEPSKFEVSKKGAIYLIKWTVF